MLTLQQLQGSGGPSRSTSAQRQHRSAPYTTLSSSASTTSINDQPQSRSHSRAPSLAITTTTTSGDVSLDADDANCEDEEELKPHKRAPRFSKTPAGGPPQDSQLGFYSTADRENLSIMKTMFLLDLCTNGAFPGKVDSTRSITEALVAASNQTGHRELLFYFVASTIYVVTLSELEICRPIAKMVSRCDRLTSWARTDSDFVL